MGIGFRELLLLLFVPIALLPTIIAIVRKHPQAVWIAVVNVLGGFVFGIGWIVALVWCLREPGNKDATGEIERLHRLLKDGALTQEEFDARKKMLLQT